MNPTGPYGPRSIGAFACVVDLVVEEVLHGSARRVMRVPLVCLTRDSYLRPEQWTALV